MAEKQSQNKIFFVGFVLIAGVIVWSLARPVVFRLASKDDNSEEKMNEEIMKAPLITPQNLFDKIQNKESVFLADIRTADDFGKGHLTASFNLTADSLNKQKLHSLGIEPNSSIVLLNKGDDVLETARKTNELAAAGFKDVKYLQGGIAAWIGQGYALISGGDAPINSGKIKKKNVEQIISDLAGGADLVQFVDLREKAGFQTGHIPGALNLPLTDLEKDQSKISPLKKVIVYGKDENEAAQAAVTLFDLNFFNIYVLEGGLDAWKTAGGKLE